MEIFLRSPRAGTLFTVTPATALHSLEEESIISPRIPDEILAAVWPFPLTRHHSRISFTLRKTSMSRITIGNRKHSWFLVHYVREQCFPMMEFVRSFCPRQQSNATDFRKLHAKSSQRRDQRDATVNYLRIKWVGDVQQILVEISEKADIIYSSLSFFLFGKELHRYTESDLF